MLGDRLARRPCARGLEAFIARTGADELMITSQIFDHAARLRSYGHGAVALFGTIQTDGTLTDIVTLESPDAELEQACRASIEQWRYAPMKLDGVPIRSDTLIVFEFNLASAKP